MSIWAEIKKALNSTVGTTKFKPLNELYLDSRYMYASDNTFLTYAGALGYHYNTNKFIVKVNIPGAYRAKVDCVSTSSDSCKASLIVYKKSGSTLTQIAQYRTDVIANGSSQTVEVDFSADKDDIITFDCTAYTISDANGGRLKNLRLCGMIGVGGTPTEIYTE